MKKYCLIGERLDYSLSPLMHNMLFSLSGMDASYTICECREQQLEQVCDSLRRDFCGANVTVPYKSAVIPFLDEITGAAEQCGAVNTIINREGRLIGDCTDGEGFIRALEMPVTGKRVLLYGSGGAARAILASLLRHGALVDVLNRTREKAAQMLEQLCAAGVDCFGARIVDAPRRTYDLSVNATPLGGVKYPDAMPALPEKLSDAGFVFDCVYSPSPTLFLRTAIQGGQRGCNGLRMLLEQGILAQRLWRNEFSQEHIAAVYSHMEQENAKR